MKQILVMILCLASFSAGCAPAVRPAAEPIDRIFYGSAEKTVTLVVFLPGRDDAVAAFEQNGFVEALRQKEINADMVSVDAHPGYYLEKKFLERLKIDVIDPARQSGYEKVWLVGVSMGALGSLLYLNHYPEEISGVVLIGPYLGDREIVEEIRSSAGLSSWSPGIVDKGDWQRGLWKGLQDFREKKNLPPVYLGYGRDDRYAEGAELFSGLLPEERVYAVRGGHLWPVWRSLWNLFLVRGTL